MLDLIKYISSIKNGDMLFVKELLVNGFNKDLINDLVNLPAVNLNEIQDCFSITIDGHKLSKKIKYLKNQRALEFEIDSWIQMGIPYKIAKKHFGLTTNEYSNRRKYVPLDFDDKNLKESDIDGIYSTYKNNLKSSSSVLEALRETHIVIKANYDLNVSIKKINEVCCEYD